MPRSEAIPFAHSDPVRHAPPLRFRSRNEMERVGVLRAELHCDVAAGAHAAFSLACAPTPEGPWQDVRFADGGADRVRLQGATTQSVELRPSGARTTDYFLRLSAVLVGTANRSDQCGAEYVFDDDDHEERARS